MHRYLVSLGLPLVTHTIANDLIRRLKAAADDDYGEGAALDIPPNAFPLARYLRGEVFAMAICVIVARLLFKLDDNYEVSLSGERERSIALL